MNTTAELIRRQYGTPEEMRAAADELTRNMPRDPRELLRYVKTMRRVADELETSTQQPDLDVARRRPAGFWIVATTTTRTTSESDGNP